MTSGGRGLQPRKQPRQGRAEITRQRILAAAAHVFAEYGHAAGTTNRIAERARVSIGSLYRYYPNKDAILVELLTRHLDAGMSALTHGQDAGASDSLEEVIRRYVRLTIENRREDPQLLRVMIEQAPRSPELLEKTSQYQQARTVYARGLIEHHPEARGADMEVVARWSGRRAGRRLPPTGRPTSFDKPRTHLPHTRHGRTPGMTAAFFLRQAPEFA
ncbi:TetR/AcrR family transcriptional regulator [Streptomyces decoyicus]|uniref:TetR/AcrR family transcriptional regulator n=1 Tax=Streptomyces decoyicus TaxID=249567 RepID=UPI0036441F04